PALTSKFLQRPERTPFGATRLEHLVGVGGDQIVHRLPARRQGQQHPRGVAERKARGQGLDVATRLEQVHAELAVAAVQNENLQLLGVDGDDFASLSRRAWSLVVKDGQSASRRL